MAQPKLTCALLLFLASAAVFAQSTFKLYPGATKYTPPDTEQTREIQQAIPPGTIYTIYVTNDSFEKVVAYYKAIGKEYSMSVPGMPKTRKLPSGQELKQTYFIFDGAQNLTESKCWAQVQRPLIGSFDENLQPRDIRDVTVITVTQKK